MDALTKLEAVTSLYRSPKGTIRKCSWSGFTRTYGTKPLLNYVTANGITFPF